MMLKMQNQTMIPDSQSQKNLVSIIWSVNVPELRIDWIFNIASVCNLLEFNCYTSLNHFLWCTMVPLKAKATYFVFITVMDLVTANVLCDGKLT